MKGVVEKAARGRGASIEKEEEAMTSTTTMSQ